MAEEKRAELEALMYEKRNVDRRLDDSKASLRDIEDQLAQLRNQVRDAEFTREKMRAEMATMREEEISLRQSISTLRISIDADVKTADEVRRRLTMLQAEEDEFKNSEHRQRIDTASLRKTLEDLTKEISECRINCEKERRAYSDLSARKQSVETDLVRCETEKQFVLDMIAEEKKRLAETEKSTSDMREEIRRLNQEVSLETSCKTKQAYILRVHITICVIRPMRHSVDWQSTAGKKLILSVGRTNLAQGRRSSALMPRSSRRQQLRSGCS